LYVWLANCYFTHDSSGFPRPATHSAMRDLVVLFIVPTENVIRARILLKSATFKRMKLARRSLMHSALPDVFRAKRTCTKLAHKIGF
jgi:hypothetical protein